MGKSGLLSALTLPVQNGAVLNGQPPPLARQLLSQNPTCFRILIAKTSPSSIKLSSCASF
jgi:hypothetical protein